MKKSLTLLALAVILLSSCASVKPKKYGSIACPEWSNAKKNHRFFQVLDGRAVEIQIKCGGLSTCKHVYYLTLLTFQIKNQISCQK